MGSFQFTLNSVEIDGRNVIEKHGLAAGGKVQQIIDSECLRLMDPYVPLDTGALRDNGIIKTEIGSGNIIYDLPYARKQYYIPMSHEGKRTDYWFEHMKNEGGKEKILKAAERASGIK